MAFATDVEGSSDRGIDWAIFSAAGPRGTITTGGLYTAPLSPGVFQVRATSQADPNEDRHRHGDRARCQRCAYPLRNGELFGERGRSHLRDHRILGRRGNHDARAGALSHSRRQR